MIKLWLQHKILENTIDSFFNGVSRNFNRNKGFKEGDYFKTISAYISNPHDGDIRTTYRNCIITYASETVVQIKYEDMTDHVRIKDGYEQSLMVLLNAECMVSTNNITHTQR